jgi:kinesin family protein 4/21/27
VHECKTAEDVIQLFQVGVKNRVTASHKLNLTSSRSHSILELKIEGIDINNSDNVISSKLELVDLAGSERISLTGAEGKQAKESIDINKSLFTLRQVISTIADSIANKNISQHVPYRDSKLTCLLK